MNFQEVKNWLHKDNHLPLIMGILNVTPDSFFDGGKFLDPDIAVNRALEMVKQGADIIDIGAESTRPMHRKISVDEELSRLIPVLEKLLQATDAVISVDTSKPEVMYEALKLGVRFINDVTALQNAASLNVVKDKDVIICLMHSEDLTQNTTNFIDEICDFFTKKISQCITADLPLENLIIDPGFGFGKNVQQNIAIVKNINVFTKFGRPILVGMSRKSTIGNILDKDVDERLYGSLALTSFALLHGANIIRTHDVIATKDTIKIMNVLAQGSIRN